jgi:glycosyltransferase involved in cell wall biosynthesis
MRVSLIIPVLNEAGSIGALLAEIPPEAADEVLVVDNGSTDDTAAIARGAGVRVVSEPRRGYGYACAAGAAVASGEALVFMDGDGSFLPEQISLLVAAVAGGADLALGTRMRGGMVAGAMPPHQLYGNRLVARLVRRLYGIPLTDLGPFRAVRRTLLSQLHMREHTYGWPIEMIVKAARRGATIIELPVGYRPRFAGQSKVGGTLRGTILATYRILSVTLRYGFFPEERHV